MLNPELLQQLAQLKAATDASMAELPNLVVEGSAGSGLVRLKMDGNYQLKSLNLAVDVKLMELEDLEDFLTLALNDAIQKVNKQREDISMQSMGKLFQQP